MTKTKILFALSVVSILLLNFINHDKAEENIKNLSDDDYREYFERHFPIAYAAIDHSVMPVKNIAEACAEIDAALSPLGEKPSTPTTHQVLATIYKALHPMTDLTASGIRLDTINAGKYRYIAVSRDLHRQGFTFGTRVMISGTGTHDGIWEVQDLMHSRWKNRIDFLSDADAPLNCWESVTMVKLD